VTTSALGCVPSCLSQRQLDHFRWAVGLLIGPLLAPQPLSSPHFSSIITQVADSMIPAGPRPSRLSLGTDVATPRDGVSPLPSPARSDSPNDDSVRVFVRLRPLNDRETTLNATPVATARGPSTVVLNDVSRGPDPYVVAVDRVLDADASQDAVFDAAGAPLVDHCLAGFNTW
jgi:hypothetical protein